MPRPNTKKELQNVASEKYAKLEDSLGSLSSAELKGAFPFEHRDRNVRDVLAHLHEWQRMMLGWYEVGMKGEQPVMPAPGYTWKTTRDLNQEIWLRYQKASLPKVRRQLEGSHHSMIAIIDAHTNQELFTKRHFDWTGSTSLGSYLISATSAHYDWALKVLRRYVKALKNDAG
ncbi:MAG: ClbS/DfsB family four-helix bundle protein [Aureliella sp.]